MEFVQLIVEGRLNKAREKEINRLGIVKYNLPMINSYVIEIEAHKLPLLKGIEGVNVVHEAKQITAQMNSARNAVSADFAYGEGLTGRGIGIAVLDTGTGMHQDLIDPKNRIIMFKDFVKNKTLPYDDNGHGTHVAGIAAGNGKTSDGLYMGIAPEADIIALKVLDHQGSGNSADVLAGLQWVLNNKDLYNIRVVNLSVGTPETGAYDPLIKAVEALWDSGIVVVAAAGNAGPDEKTITSPGISRKVITVGASDDNDSVVIWGSSMVNFSGRGPTIECIVKPDLVAPGTNIISCLTPDLSEKDIQRQSKKIIGKSYLSLNGTSMATPIVSGSIALLLEKYPELTPDDIKYMLKKCSVDLHYPKNQQGWGLINIKNLLSLEAKHVRE